MKLIDSHCHFDDDRFDADRDAVLLRAQNTGIQQQVIPATTAARWPKVRQIAGQYEGVYASYGLHPMFMQQHDMSHIQSLEQWLEHNEAVAVGECGLDFYIDNHDEKQQLELFRAQLKLAKNFNLPVIIHARKAMDIVLREIRSSAVESGVVHSFSGSLQQAQKLHELGFKIGIAATISFERAKKLRQVVTQMPVESLLIESDAPDQPGASHRGERNEPSFIMDHLSVMADLRDMEPATLARQLNTNCRALFRF